MDQKLVQFFFRCAEIFSTTRIWSLDGVFTRLAAIMYDLLLALPFCVAQNVSKCIFMDICGVRIFPSH